MARKGRRFGKLRFGFEEGGFVPEEEMRYAVVENMPGYLPESEPAYFETKAEAEAYAKEQEADLEEQGLSDVYVVDIVDVLPEHLHEGAIIAEGIPVDSVPAMIGGNEAVIPLDDPEAVEVMADAIEEGTGGSDAASEQVSEAAEAVAEAAEAVAEASEEVAEAASDVAESNAEVAETAIAAGAVESVAATEAAEEIAEEVAEVSEEATEDTTEAAEEIVEEATKDRAPRESHWAMRSLFGGRKK